MGKFSTQCEDLRAPASDAGAASWSSDPFLEPELVRDPNECTFYHWMDLPTHGEMPGHWDLRTGVADYLGRVDFRGKRALDVGPANGFLTFAMERAGAEVVAYDLPADQPFDLLRSDLRRNPNLVAERARLGRRVRNAFWLAHGDLGSRARMALGSVYDVPESIGEFDVGVIGCVLLHLRDPIGALEQLAERVRETLVVVEPVGVRRAPLLHRVLRRFPEPKMIFLPDGPATETSRLWWTFTPESIRRFLAVLGFPRTRVVRHAHRGPGGWCKFFTVVGSRSPSE